MGDDNSAYFHRCINGRKAANAIPGVLVNGEWISQPSLVKKEVFRFYRDHFRENASRRPGYICGDLKQVALENRENLIAPFSKEEIKEAVFDCGSDKAPGFHETGVIHKDFVYLLSLSSRRLKLLSA